MSITTVLSVNTKSKLLIICFSVSLEHFWRIWLSTKIQPRSITYIILFIYIIYLHNFSSTFTFDMLRGLH